MKIPGPVELLLSNVFVSRFVGLHTTCSCTAGWVQVEDKEEMVKKLGGFHGFPRAGSPLSAVAVLPSAPLQPGRRWACTVHQHQNVNVVFCSGMCLWWSPGRNRMSQAPAVQLELEAPDAQNQAEPAHTNSAQTSYSLHVAPRFPSRISGQEHRYPVLNNNKTVALVCPLSKIEKPPFNQICHIILAFLSIHRKGNNVLHSWVMCPSLGWDFCSSQFPKKHQGLPPAI